MGGYGSGRSGGRPTVESALGLRARFAGGSAAIRMPIHILTSQGECAGILTIG
jgi:hypothetical protein